jgi:hypothetical protein
MAARSLPRGHFRTGGLNGSLDGLFILPTYTLGSRTSISRRRNS